MTSRRRALIPFAASTPRFELATLLEYKLDDGARGIGGICADPQVRASARARAVATLLPRGRLADWNGRDELVRLYRDAVKAHVPVLSPFALLALPSTRAEQRTCARTWTAPISHSGHEPPPWTERAKLRIGYLSADFHTHATAYLAAGLFERHDRGRFEIRRI